MTAPDDLPEPTLRGLRPSEVIDRWIACELRYIAIDTDTDTDPRWERAWGDDEWIFHALHTGIGETVDGNEVRVDPELRYRLIIETVNRVASELVGDQRTRPLFSLGDGCMSILMHDAPETEPRFVAARKTSPGIAAVYEVMFDDLRRYPWYNEGTWWEQQMRAEADPA